MKTVEKVFHPAQSRGHANHGWLDSYHSFSFAQYYDPEKMNFGVLRVLNDDKVSPGMGFPTHGHDNMEIISIPLKGDLEHKDSMGNIQIIRQGDVQIMSAGTGVRHSEYNHSQTEDVNFLQIWILPQQRQIQPRYEQKQFALAERQNRWQRVVSPDKSESESVWINQDAYFSLGHFDAGQNVAYQLNDYQHGVYLLVLEGQVELGDQILNRRDAMGLSQLSEFDFEVKQTAEILLMEVSMRV